MTQIFYFLFSCVHPLQKGLLTVQEGDQDPNDPAATSGVAILSVLRLEKDEVGCRPIALAGTWGEVTPDRLRSVPKVSSEGPFAAFTVDAVGANWPWAPLPAFSIVSLAGRPVAFNVPNCADLPALRATVRVKSDDDLRKLQGPGLLVVDVQPSTKVALNDGSYYLVVTADGGLDMAEGETI